MNFHALSVLEFRGVLNVVAGHASSPLGAERVRSLTPVNDGRWIADEHLRVTAMRSLVSGEDAWRPQPIPDLRAALGRLRAAGGVWPATDLLAGVTLLRSSRLTRETLKGASSSEFARAVLSPLAMRLTENVEAERAIDRAIDADAQVRDQASPELRRVRRDLRGAESELVQLLDRIMARLDPHQRVADMSVTVRNGRYVIPVRREARGSVGGIVHDESATGGTLFVEPPAAVEFGNRIRELQAHELREVDRILRTLTESIRPMRDALLDSLEALVELDSLYARARLAEAFSCAQMAFVTPSEGFKIVQGRHPLLLATGAIVVPFDLRMEPHERTLLLSGPNTGGKTVLLKALGLISAMAQAGIPACVGEGSHVAVFDDFFADIGDEQSIEASLSTFSAHLKNLGAVLEGATAESLVLIDELGSGTDPAEGAALGSAILESLSERGAMTVATTHLGALKLLATERQGVVNASLQFDEIALAPTYRLVKGIPGRSYGLGIARRLRIPAHVIDRAEAALPRGELDVAALLSDLERRTAELAERERFLSEATERMATRLEAVGRREQELREAERLLERKSRSEARQHLLEARKEVEELVRGLRASSASDDTLRDARRRIESLASEHAKALERLEQNEVARNEIAGVAASLEVGDFVAVETLGGREGRVVEIRDGEAVVAVGALKVAVPSAKLRRSRTVSEPPSVSVALSGDTPELHVASEIDLRGLRVDETERALMHTLDSAVRADLRLLRIIHGKGTGALRDRVAELLRGDVRVRSFRLGAWNEGGAGVTIAELT